MGRRHPPSARHFYVEELIQDRLSHGSVTKIRSVTQTALSAPRVILRATVCLTYG